MGSPPPTPRTRWTGRTDPLIVEVAEALGCPTDLVAGVGRSPGRATFVVAAFSPGYPADEAVYGATLARDGDGILRERRRRKLADSLADLLDEAGS